MEQARLESTSLLLKALPQPAALDNNIHFANDWNNDGILVSNCGDNKANASRNYCKMCRRQFRIINVSNAGSTRAHKRESLAGSLSCGVHGPSWLHCLEQHVVWWCSYWTTPGPPNFAGISVACWGLCLQGILLALQPKQKNKGWPKPQGRRVKNQCSWEEQPKSCSTPMFVACR